MKRTKIYYQKAPEYSEEDISILNAMDKIYTDLPCYGYRRTRQELINIGFHIGKDRVLKYKNILGLSTLYPKRKTTIRNHEHKVYPYLLRDLKIDRPNQVWSTDITYIKMMKGFCYLVAIIDCFSRKILAFRVSNVMNTEFCLEALEDAARTNPKPMIFNTDQGCQFTSKAFTEKLKELGILISMDSKGRATDNAIIERFWRTIKYENIYQREYQTMIEVEVGVKIFIDFYNNKRIHSSLGYQVPARVHASIKSTDIPKTQVDNLKENEKSIA